MLCRHRVTVGLIIQVVALHLAVVYGKGGGGGGSAGGGGGTAAGGSGRGTTSSSAATTQGGWSAGGAKTAGGSSLARTSQTGRAVSTRPMYYGSGGYAATSYSRRPVMWATGAFVMFYFYSRSSNRVHCTEGFFAYGHSCRKCSDWECPIGQYRSTCTPHNDGYCTKCSNAPQDTSAMKYTYMTPGNDNDCEFKTVSAGDANVGTSAEFSNNEPAGLIMFLEMPIKSASFMKVATEFRQAVAAAAGLDSADDVLVNDIKEYTMGTVDDINDCCTEFLSPTCSEHTNCGDSQFCSKACFQGLCESDKDVCQPCEECEYGDDAVDGACPTKCSQVSTATCCERRRTMYSRPRKLSSSRHLLQLDNATNTTNSTAENSSTSSPTTQPVVTTAADMVTQIVSTPAPKIGECTPQTELAYDAIEKFVVVETEVLTTVGKVCCSELWVVEWYGVMQCGVVVDTEVLTTVGKVCRSEL